MNFEEQLKQWDLYFHATRQIGHTHAAMNGVLNTKNAMLVTASEMARASFPNPHWRKNTFSFQLRLDPSIKAPVVFDNFTIHQIIVKSLFERIDKAKVKEVVDANTVPFLLVRVGENKEIAHERSIMNERKRIIRELGLK